ncbi:hypothetical protein UFOVP240_117 [uncultured Caudovirales phage]|uniref:Cytidyltransferase-like domain-containing protein n=1 Tax=uncultured Caudovirales phage TaxID=2100421 RepID=A0A6J7X1T7_9CAUD|nr:hypothetical protein UFOVP240_117 [uncultured Caudovirales phage]
MDKMKDYRQLIKELPSRTIVCAFGEFNPPTTGHELLVKTVNKLAEQRNSDHVIFTSPSKNNSLLEEKKSQYLKLMFPTTKFKLSESKVSSIKSLSERYKNIVVVTGSEQSTDLKKVLKEYTNIEVISITEKDPDALDSKMKSYATKGIYEEFKKKLPSTIRELDARRLMNDMRETMGLDSVKEQIVLVKDKLRDDYFRGEVFNVGDIVESNGVKYTIAKRGSNHLLLKESSGALVSKWIHDVQPTEEKEMNEDLTDKTIKVTDKIKVARIIATMLGVDNAEASSNPENLVNTALRKVRSKSLNPESLAIINKMMHLAAEVGIEYDNNLVPTKLKEGTIQTNGTSQLDTPVDAPKVVKKIEKKAKAQDKLPIKFTDFTKNLYNKEPDPEPVGPESQADTAKGNESDIDADFDTKQMDKKEVGHTLVSPGGQDNLRRRKVKYQMGEQKGPYEMEGGHENTAQHIMNAPSKEHGVKSKKLAKSFLDRMQDMSESNELSEVSSALLDRYKAGAKKSADDLTAQGNHKKSADRWMGVMKATGKQIDKTTAGIKKALNKEEKDIDAKAITKQELAHKKNKGGFKGFMIANLQRKVEEGYGRNKDYSHGFASPHAPNLSARGHREDDEGWDREPKHKQADVPHAVHINGKKWKSFGSQSHASNVAKKIKGATIHKEEVELEEATTGATKVVHTRTGADGAKYHIMQDSPTDYSVHREHNGKTKHIDTYGSLHRAKSVLDNEVKEETIIEDAYKDAEGHLDKADKAQRNKDMFSHHMHMADHHDSLSQWHDSKGRSSAAEKHANKAADHEEMAHAAKKIREEVELEEAQTPQQKMDFEKMMKGAMSRDSYNTKWKKPLKSVSKVVYGKNVKEEVELTESHAELSKHISDFSKGVKSSSAKQSTYKRDNKPIHNMKHVETDADHHAVFKHLQKMGYKKTSGYDPKPHEFSMTHNHESMTTKSDPVHHASGVSAHIEKEHGGKTKVHFTHRNIKEELEESMTDSWKNVQSMDKGSLAKGKEEAKKHLEYLKAVHAHHKKFGNDTLSVRKKIEGINRSRLAESEQELDELKKKIECPTCVDGKCQCPPDEKEKAIDSTQINKPFDPFFEEVEEKELDLSDKEIDQMIDKLEDEDLLEAYDEDELSLIDEETGEELEQHPDEDKISIMEVLSRTERMKAKFRLRRTASKRARSTKIALKRYSSTETVNKRARRLAIMLMKKRMLRGRNPSQVSVGEKERIEKAISKRKTIITRIASKLVSRIRKVEKARMSHSKFTKGSSNVSF